MNINGLVPNIALERIEIVKDGASALYGSDAIAGVVNFITKQDFEGFDLNYQFTTDDETGKGDANQMGVIFGVQGDRGGIVASASFLNRDEINVDDRYERYGGSTASGTGQPGRIVPRVENAMTDIIWDDHGLDPGQPTGGLFPRDALGTTYGQADVDCENAAALEQGGPLGPVSFGPGPLVNLLCAYDFGSFFALQSEESLRKMHVIGHYDVTDNFEANFEFAANDSEFDRLNSLNPNAPILTIPTTHPGNIEDAFRRGIRPIEVGNQTRLLGGTRNTPNNLRPLGTFTNTTRSDQRIVIGGVVDTELFGREWNIDASYTASEHDTATTQSQDTLSAQFELSIQGLGGPSCDVINGTPGSGNLRWAETGEFFGSTGDNCFFFNPYGSAIFARDGSLQTDGKLLNPPELYDFLLGRVTSDIEYRQRVIDIVASGEIFDVPAGPVGLAVGFQRRRDTGDAVYDGATLSNNLDFAFGVQDWSGELTTTAFFVELGIPITDALEVNIAGRFEDFDEIDEDTTDPKITILWHPVDSLSIRASAGSSFRVPSIQQLFGSITTVHNLADTGLGGTAFRPAVSTGNIDLQPESSDNFNIGFSWVPQDGILEGLQVDVDYYDYEYEDIITREDHSTLLAEDLAELGAYRAANGGTLLDAINAGAGNREQVLRNPTGGLLRVLPRFANANGADISGIDLNASYRFGTNFGNWRVGIQAAYLHEYEVEVNNPRTGITTVFDAVGQYNDTNPVARPLPEWKANATLGWTLDNHRAFLIVKYVEGVHHNLTSGATFFAATAGLAHGADFAADFLDSEINNWTTADIQYTYNFGETSFLSDSSVTLGIQNVTNEEPPFVPVITGYDGTLHDPRGRVWFVKVAASM